MDSPVTGYWITEYTTYKIFADSEREARTIWNRYWCDGVPAGELDMSIKDGGVEADWSWTREDGE
jgi:hypothetical protein